MVEFCKACGTSLPRGDVTINKGKLFTSHDYVCPSCGGAANPDPEADEAIPDPETDSEMTFKDGELSIE